METSNPISSDYNSRMYHQYQKVILLLFKFVLLHYKIIEILKMQIDVFLLLASTGYWYTYQNINTIIKQCFYIVAFLLYDPKSFNFIWIHRRDSSSIEITLWYRHQTFVFNDLLTTSYNSLCPQLVFADYTISAHA